MADVELPPDPYLALGVAKDADAATIKTAYRKLVLKCHPDKVPDPAAKQAAADRFHIIQTSYERLTDEKARARYDAEVKLAELRKERAFHRGGADTHATSRSAYKTATYEPSRQAYDYRPSEKATPMYEERRPAYADYFDAPPKQTTRKEPEPERTSRRSAPESKEKVRASKTRDIKEDRREKSKKATKETKQEREQKYSRPPIEVVSSEETDSDVQARRSRRTYEAEREDRRREEVRRDDLRREDLRREDARREADRREDLRREDSRREDGRRSRDVFNEPTSRSKLEPESEYFPEDRTRKMFAADDKARDYINRAVRSGQASDARPLPSRMTSTRDSYDSGPKNESRPEYVVRRPSTKPRTSSRDPEAMPRSVRDRERYSSTEEPTRTRPPAFHSSRSMPVEHAEKPRAQSMQHEPGEIIPPAVKRATTMPSSHSRGGRSEKPARTTEFYEGLATPGTTPEYPEPPGGSYRFDRSRPDERDVPMSSGYREDYYSTEVREPRSEAREGRRREPRDAAAPPAFTSRMTSSPSPEKEIRLPSGYDSRDSRDTRERPERPKYSEWSHSSAANTRKTSYRYEELPTRSRPSTAARETSYREPAPQYQQPLYGEIPQTAPTAAASPRTTQGHYSDDRGYTRSFPHAGLSVQTGYQTKRTTSGRPQAVGQKSSATIY